MSPRIRCCCTISFYYISSSTCQIDGLLTEDSLLPISFSGSTQIVYCSCKALLHLCFSDSQQITCLEIVLSLTHP